MKKIYIVFLLLFMWSWSKAGDLILEAGSSWSYFRNEGGTSHAKPCLGVGLQFYPIPKFNGFWSIGLKYLRKKMVLENKSWPTNAYDDANVKVGDIIIDYSYLEIPLGFGYRLDWKNKLTSIFFIEGSMALPIKEYSKTEIEEVIILEPEEKRLYKFDYFKVDEPVVNHSQNINLGFQIIYGSFGVDLIYIRAIESTKSFSGLTIKDYVDSFRVLICYRFRNFTSINLKK